MIRLTALWLFISGLAFYVKRDWWVSLCGLILLMTVIEHPDAPKSILGVQGLSPWNLLLVVVVGGWLVARRREGLVWDMPRPVTVLLLLYLAVLLVSFVRLMLDRSYLGDETTASLVSEHLINRVKWVIPALMLFDGCRSRRRFYMAIAAILGVYLLLGLYVIKWMPIGLLTDGEALERRALKVLVNEIGYHRVNMSMMLAGASWAIFCARVLVTDARTRALIVAAAAATLFGQALTGGRMGYVTWALVGLVLLSIRGRALLVAVPFAAAAVLLLVPAVGQRLLQGFDPSTSEYEAYYDHRLGNPLAPEEGGADLATITAGRSRIWPYVIERIEERPIVGYGRLAMIRTGLTAFLATNLGEGFDHPHNAYLEMLFDNGILGLLAVLPFYILALFAALSLYADGRSPIFVAIGGITAALVMALLVAAMGSQTFYPREGAVGMWCALGLMLRVWVERRRADRAPQPVPVSPPVVTPRLAWPSRRPGAPAAAAAAAAVTVERPRPAPAESIDVRLWKTA